MNPRGGGFGQFFTPRHITRFCADLLNSGPDGVLYDPFCGTGGMLLAGFKRIASRLDPTTAEDQRRLRRLKKHGIHLRDISAVASGPAKMNMVLIGDGHSGIERIDSLATEAENGRPDADHVLTHIPLQPR